MTRRFSILTTLRVLRQPLTALAVLGLLFNVATSGAQAASFRTLCAVGSDDTVVVSLNRDGQPTNERASAAHCPHCLPPAHDMDAALPPRAPALPWPIANAATVRVAAVWPHHAPKSRSHPARAPPVF